MWLTYVVSIYMSRKNKQIHGLDVANHAIETDNIVNIVKEISELTVQLKGNIPATSGNINCNRIHKDIFEEGTSAYAQ